MDIFDPTNPRSITRARIGSAPFSVQGCAECYHIPPEYLTLDARIADRNEVESITDQVVAPSLDNGYSARIFTPVYEAVLNAFQHGNRENPDKTVRIGFTPHAQFAVLDEGDAIRASLASYILALRQGLATGTFYEFTQEPKKGRNYGMGTLLMHEQFEVNYYPGDLGGLAVVMEPKRYALK